jgi:hypothetical protein
MVSSGAMANIRKEAPGNTKRQKRRIAGGRQTKKQGDHKKPRGWIRPRCFCSLARPSSFLLYFFYTATIGFGYVAVTAVN